MNQLANAPVNILFLTTELRPGGAEKCLVNLACGLDQTKFRPIVASIRPSPSSAERRLVDQLERAEIPTFFLNCHSKLSSWRTIGTLRKLMVEHGINVVQSFLIHANILAGLALRKLPNIKLFTGIRVADPSKIRHLVERWATSKSASKIVCVSESIKRFAAKTMKLPVEKLIAIPNGVETPKVDDELAASRSDDKFSIQSPFVVFVGRLEPQKGLVQFLDAFREKENSLPPFELVFIGEGSQKAQLVKLANQLERRCHFLGWQANPYNYVINAESAFLPSLWEGMPNVLLETMALGKSFVAFGVDGVLDLVENSDHQVAEAGNYPQFLDKLSQLVVNSQLAEQLGTANRLRVENNFSIKKMIAKYEAVYLGNPDFPS